MCVWCVVCGVCGVWCVVCGVVWCAMVVKCTAICSTDICVPWFTNVNKTLVSWCVVCGVWCVECGMWCGVVCGIHYVLYVWVDVWCAVCTVWCVECGVVWCVV